MSVSCFVVVIESWLSTPPVPSSVKPREIKFRMERYRQLGIHRVEMFQDRTWGVNPRSLQFYFPTHTAPLGSSLEAHTISSIPISLLHYQGELDSALIAKEI